jgi:hypothetical protein
MPAPRNRAGTAPLTSIASDVGGAPSFSQRPMIVRAGLRVVRALARLVVVGVRGFAGRLSGALAAPSWGLRGARQWAPGGQGYPGPLRADPREISEPGSMSDADPDAAMRSRAQRIALDPERSDAVDHSVCALLHKSENVRNHRERIALRGESISGQSSISSNVRNDCRDDPVASAFADNDQSPMHMNRSFKGPCSRSNGCDDAAPRLRAYFRF